MSRKNKFDLTHLVHVGALKEGEKLCFVSDPAKFGVIKKLPNGEFKVTCGEETLTVHALAQKFLGQEPPDHASRWLRSSGGKTLYELWQADQDRDAA
jgi:hypothetical protein